MRTASSDSRRSISRISTFRLCLILILLAVTPVTAGAGQEKLPPIAVELAVIPNHPHDVVDVGLRGSLTVAILSSSGFDAASVNPATVNLAGAPVVGPSSLVDVNGDNLPDLVVSVLRRRLRLEAASNGATLCGTTWDGRYVEGSEIVRPRKPQAPNSSREKLPVLRVEIDVLPGISPKLIDLATAGTENVVVAMLGSAAFDPLTIDPATLDLSGSPAAENDAGRLEASAADVNGDARQDLVVSFTKDSLQIDENATEVTLRGTMPDGRIFEGSSPVEVRGIRSSSPPAGVEGQTIFSNETPLVVPDASSAGASSSITVSGLSGVVSAVTVTLRNLNHPFPDDLDILLVGPDGKSAVLLSDAGGYARTDGLTLTFSSSASIALPDAGPLTSGVFQPTNVGVGDEFPTQGPDSWAADLSVFSGSNPNGTWSLFVVDDLAGDAGSLSGGWSLSVLTATQVCNVGSISIPDSGAATPYPSTISATGLIGGVSSVTVELKNFGHTFPDDVDVLLVGPGGQTAIVMSDAGGGADVTGLNLTLSDAAATALSDAGPLASGTFRPANYEPGDPYPAPAPVPSGGSVLSTFNGTNPNGTWSLYVVDDTAQDLGSFAGGWCLNVTTPATQFCNTAAISIPDSGAGTPYPSNITTSGLTGSVACVTVDLKSLTHTFPDDVDVLLEGPSGQNAIIMSDVGGSVAASGVNLTLADSAASAMPDAGSLTSGTFRPTNIGSGDAFPAPAPAPAGGSALSVFAGTAPNGVWKLYLVDDETGDVGSLGGGWCLNVVACNCNDGNPCTTDTCDCATGQCIFTPNTNPCSDGNACTLNDTCSMGVCVGGPPVDCNDNNPCTNDSCSPATGTCTHTPNALPCDDGLFCTVGDQCSGGVCTGSPRDCSDTSPCTNDTCDEANDQCVHTVVGRPYTYRAGRMDLFLFGQDPAFRRACLTSSYPGAVWTNFDDSTLDRFVGHSFTGLPANIIKAVLTIRMRPSGSGSTNDSINLGLSPACNGTWSFSRTIALLPGAGGVWSGNAPTTFTLDLAALPGGGSILTKIATDRFLDLLVQDDTAVDWAKLQIWTCPQRSVFFGLLHEPLGQAHLDPDGSGNVVISNIGPSGSDGARVDIGQTEGWGFTLVDVNPHDEPVGAFKQWTLRGTVDGVPDQVAWTERHEVVSPGGMKTLQVSADFSPLGATMVEVEVFYRNRLIASRVFPNGPVYDFPDMGPGFPPLTLTEQWSTTCVVKPTDPWKPKLSDGTHIDNWDSIVIYAANPTKQLSVYTSAESTAGGVSQATLEDEILVAFGRPMRALSAATLEPFAGNLSVANLGSSGKDGLSIELGRTDHFNFGLDPLDVDGAAPIGASLEARAIGSFNGQLNSSLGQIRFAKAAAGYDITADFTAVGSPTQHLQVLNGGALVADFPGHSGPVGTSSHLPINIGKLGGQTECLVSKWETSGFPLAGTTSLRGTASPLTGTTITIDGNGYTGDELRVLSEGGGRIDFKSGLLITSSLPEFTIVSADVTDLNDTVTVVGKNTLSWLEQLQAQTYDVAYRRNTVARFDGNFSVFVNPAGGACPSGCGVVATTYNIGCKGTPPAGRFDMWLVRTRAVSVGTWNEGGNQRADRDNGPQGIPAGVCP